MSPPTDPQPAGRQASAASGNAAIHKLSPELPLSEAQKTLRDAVLSFCIRHRADGSALFIIEGAAGTGKSVVLNAIFNALQSHARHNRPGDPLGGTRNMLLVNHPEMLKLYRNIAATMPDLRKADFERPTTFINRMRKSGQRADIVLVDEAHLLLTRPDRYNHFVQQNHLEEILHYARTVVIVFDPLQVLKFKSHWSVDMLDRFRHGRPSETFHLTTQFRVAAAPGTQTWIDALGQGKLLPRPQDSSFDLRIYDDCTCLYNDLKTKNTEYGLCRLLSTYDYPYRLDGQDHFITEGRFHLRWDRSKPDEKLPWAERPDTIDEVGSVYTIQGFDLNYAGVILGPSLYYDRALDRIRVNPARYEDSAAFQGRDGIATPGKAKERIILNALNVLLTRGIHGLYLYAHDPALRERLLFS
ncbi:DUF2075 domain-containing protein [Gluconobacter morbifer]|uniref:AAA+ ATPase domain-containing protein n=1 Tax=Gluconobacter morbifer G707 TaxID=1088869 RepID=G6XL13_9PROT|nr:DUF2075 domain-containing protein [Gluconobacter morbifer]EHH67441.1 hypothetical protein GMO_24360 [Gluconobacter morbifer G707]